MPLEPYHAEFIEVTPSNFSQRLKGKTLVLTGGRSGIGFEIAKTFLEAGANVVIGDLSPADDNSDEADWFANGGHKDRLEWFTPCNVTKFEDQKGLFARAVERFKEVHFVSANA
jgi:3-oxoacyl-[acyl-carrier protein] reductase